MWLARNDASARATLDRIVQAYSVNYYRFNTYWEQLAVIHLSQRDAGWEKRKQQVGEQAQQQQQRKQIQRRPPPPQPQKHPDSGHHHAQSPAAPICVVSPRRWLQSFFAGDIQEYQEGDLIAHVSGGNPPAHPWPTKQLAFIMERIGLQRYWDEEAESLTEMRNHSAHEMPALARSALKAVASASPHAAATPTPVRQEQS